MSRLGASNRGGSSTFPQQSNPELNSLPTTNTATAPIDADSSSLDRARQAVDDSLRQDDTGFPSFANMPRSVDNSGTYTAPFSPAWTPFDRLATIPLPGEILLEFERLGPNVNVDMGTLPEVDRAWIHLNETLFLWDYVEGQSDSYITYLSSKGSMEHPTDVALVPVKPGVFVDTIPYLLLVFRKSSIELIGISTTVLPAPAGGLPRRGIDVYDTDIAIATEIQMASPVGLPDGRIFFCGGGALWELTYSATSSYFKSQTSYLTNHSLGGLVGSYLPSFLGGGSTDDLKSIAYDKTRKTLYGLTNDNRIIMFYIDAGQKPVKTAIVADIAITAQGVRGGDPRLDSKSFVIDHVIPIPEHDSVDIRLMAVTTFGVRLYFSAAPPRYDNRYGGQVMQPQQPRTNGLHLLHVRFPPDQLQSPVEPPPNPNGGSDPSFWSFSDISYGAFKDGMSVLGASTNREQDLTVVLCMVPDIPSFRHPEVNAAANNAGQQYGMSRTQPPVQSTASQMLEFACLLPIRGDIGGLAFNPSVPPVSFSSGWNELAAQFSGPSPSFLILTNFGMHMISRRKPVQTLCELLEDFTRDSDMTTIDHFAHTYGPTETIAMMFAIAADNSYLAPDKTITSAVAQDAILTGSVLSLSAVSANARELAKSYLYQYGGKPTTVYGPTTKYSPRFEALSLYFSRLVRPMWKKRIITGIATRTSTVSAPVLTSIQRDLERLKGFLANNPQMFIPVAADYGNRSGAGAVDQDAWRVENVAMTQLQTLLNQSIEAISFVLLLSDFNMPVTVGKMDGPLQNALVGLTYEDFLTTQRGKETARNLVNAVINQQINQQISVEAISEVLQERCGSFCSADDVMLYKAQEQVRRAKELPPGRERSSALEQSVRLFEKGTKNMSVQRLQSICLDYTELQFAYGLVLLPLKCAQNWDTDARGEAYFNDGCPPNDSRSEALELRRACYQCIVDSISSLSDNETAAESAGRPDQAAVFKETVNHALNMAFRSQDFVFHSYLYDYLIEREPSQFIELDSAYVERYLIHEPRTLQKTELLWQYYVRTGRNMDAARVLATLSESSDFGLSLEQRIEFLSRAIGNAKSTSGDGLRRFEADGEFLSDLEDKLDVATVQMEILARLARSIPRPDEDPHIFALGDRLMTISELYRDYADPFDLPDMKLLILHTSEHQDTALVTSIWTAIIDSYRNKENHFSLLGARVSELGRRFYPSTIAFPLDILSEMLETYSLEWADAPPGWAMRTLSDGNVPHEEVLDYFDQIRESGVPPYQDNVAMHRVLIDITTFLGDWLDEVLRPGSRFAKGAFPAGKVEDMVDRYLSSMRGTGDTQLKRRLMDIQSKVRNRF